MRNRRILMQMAGLLPTPWEKREQRLTRQIVKYANDLQQREHLLTMIARRERGEENAKPMPEARAAIAKAEGQAE